MTPLPPRADPPAPAALEHRLGRYGMQVTRSEDGFMLERVLIVFPLALPPKDYPEIRSFFDQVRRADRAQLTFTREEAAR